MIVNKKLVWIVGLIGAGFVSVMLVQCGSKSKSSDTPAGIVLTADKLSTQFAAKCAGCHGTTAAGGNGYPTLTGYDDGKTEFTNKIRNGYRSMPSFSTTDYSDASLDADYKAVSGTN